MPQHFHEFKRLLPYAKGSLFAQIVIFLECLKGFIQRPKVSLLYSFICLT